MNLRKHIIIGLKLTLVGIVIASVIYPLLLGGIGQIWANQAKGSLITQNGEIVGSKLIGQNFTDSRYFKSRPSSINYDSSQSGSDNLAPNNPLLVDRVSKQLQEINEKYDPGNIAVPADFVTESGSALDPHISPESAYFQVDYIAQETGIESSRLNSMIEEHTDKPLIGLFGKSRVNVLELNLSLKEVLDND